MPRPKGIRAYVVVGPYGGLYRFNGVCGFYESSANRGLGDVFFHRRDAVWVRDYEVKIFKTLGEKDKSYLEMAKKVQILPVLIRPHGPSADVRAMRMALMEMKRTGYFPSKREVEASIKQFEEDKKGI
jgi:hypothetical protein